MSKKEQLYQLVRSHPSISQQALADQLHISRSAVAGYIASLIREGRILGRAYVLPSERPLMCIGGANIDRKLRTYAALQMGTSNPVSQIESFGGVARNIAENLAHLASPDLSVQLISALGDDVAGESLRKHAESVGIDVKSCLQVSGEATGSYTALLDEQGGLLLAMAHMTLCDALTPEFLARSAQQRRNAALVIADLNLSQASLQMLLQEAQQSGSPLLFVAVSEPKMQRLPLRLDGLRLLILNQYELQALAGRMLDDHAQIADACASLQKRGAVDIVVTLGADGVIWTDAGNQAGFCHLLAIPVTVTDVTGAGDAFAAAVCWSLAKQPDDLAAACQQGLLMAAQTVQNASSVAIVS